MTEATYHPGVCNIGTAEIAHRRRVGWFYLGITVLGLLALLVLKTNPLLRLALFIPATASASGFLQARNSFCYGFALSSVYNFRGVGEKTKIADEVSRQLDLRKGLQILIDAMMIGAAITVGTLLL